MRSRNRSRCCSMSTYQTVILSLVVFIILLQGFYMTFLMTVQVKNPSKQKSSEQILPNDHIKKRMKDLIKQINDAYRMDLGGTYMIVPNLVTPVLKQSEGGKSEVAICTQSTANNLHYLMKLSETWNGPISVTVFTHRVDVPYAVYVINLLHICSESIKRHVRFHLTFPISHPPMRLNSLMQKNFACDKLAELREKNSSKNFESSGLPYPHNVLRNVAITFTTSPYIFMIDIDFIPSKDLRNQFQHFIERRAKGIEFSEKDSKARQLKAYVIPCFESKLPDLTAITKQELIQEWKLGNIRPFYSEMCSKCQRVTDYDKWKAFPNVDFMEMGYFVDWADPWEPFYIAKKSDLPLYDERFKQYGFNRISQVCEMHVAGFKFAVMNNGFVVHQGFKQKETFHRSKEEDNNKNRELYRTFKTQMKERYRDSKLEC